MLRFAGKCRRSLLFPRGDALLRRTSTDSRHPTLQRKTESASLSPVVRIMGTDSLVPPPSDHPRNRFLLLAVGAGTLVSTATAAFLLLSDNGDDSMRERSRKAVSSVEDAVGRRTESIQRVSSATSAFYDRIVQTGVAASVLWKSMCSVLSSANHEVRSGFGLRVAALLADITAANESRRAAIVAAGGGAVVDWLLETVSCADASSRATQAESARALAHLISDPRVCEAVLARPQAVPSLLRFIFSYQPQRAKKKGKQTFLDQADSLQGRSMLVAAIMDIVTSNCDNVDKFHFHPQLSASADMRDVAIALEVVVEGGMRLDEPHDSDDGEDNDKGIKGIGIKVLGGTGIIGFSRNHSGSDHKLPDGDHLDPIRHFQWNSIVHRNHRSGTMEDDSFPLPVSKLPHLNGGEKRTDFHGLWDDLHCRHVAVPFATWALANWASASQLNRTHIQELDRDGQAVMTALMAPERTVRWHGSLIALMLLEDKDLPLSESVPDWASNLLCTVSQATKSEDLPLTNLSLAAFLVSLERSGDARRIIMDKGLDTMRGVAKSTSINEQIQEQLAKALELLSSGDRHFSLQEAQKWAGILLPWVSGHTSSELTRISATTVLARILEDFGPASIPISQGWLAILLNEALLVSKAATVKGSALRKGDKVKTQLEQSNSQMAVQVVKLLANAIMNSALSQSDIPVESFDSLPLGSLLCLEPFADQLKTRKGDDLPKIAAADAAVATLKGIKALTCLCYEDLACQNHIVDSGILCLLRRFLLSDDYEQLAASEAYDASRVFEAQERGSSSGDPSVPSVNGSSSVRVPSTAHIRRHAARLLTVLSLLPKVQKAISLDAVWLKWLDDCANGRISGCNDPKIQSYARATQLNILCPGHAVAHGSSDGGYTGDGLDKGSCPKYDDMIFLINPELSHWKCPDVRTESDPREGAMNKSGEHFHPSLSPGHCECLDDESTVCRDGADSNFCVGTPDGSPHSVDVVFIHGLRGGPFKTWRIAEDKSSTTSKSGLVEKIDQEAGKEGTCWPKEWLSSDLPHARLFTVKYKTNLTQWSGASLPLQEVSALLLKKLVAAGIGSHPTIFVTHSMGGLVVKQMLHQAKDQKITDFIKNTIGIVFYSCPHFGSKLADVPWRMGLVFRSAPSVGELRSGSSKLVELNDFIRYLHNRQGLDVLSFSETMVTPIIEGYGGWAFRMEIVPIESAYPGFGDLVVLDATDHINSCKPVSRSDPSYAETLQFLLKLREKSMKSR